MIGLTRTNDNPSERIPMPCAPDSPVRPACSVMSGRTGLAALVGSLLILFLWGAFQPAQASLIFKAHLNGAQEVPPVTTAASGHAHFEFNDALTELYYELHVFDIVDVTQAHIHLGPVGVNGPVVLWLYPSAPPPFQIAGTFNGLLASATVDATDLVGQLADEPLSALRAEMLAGNAYVNVHTVGNPPGEIRGQISAVPEPSMVAMIALGLALMALIRHMTPERAGRAHSP